MEKTTYTLNSFKAEGPEQLVVFHKLNEDGTFEHGTTLEEILCVSIERLQELNERFSCRENALLHQDARSSHVAQRAHTKQASAWSRRAA